MLGKLKNNAIRLILSGLSACCVPAFAADIVVAQIGPFTGLPSPDQIEINQAAQAYFDLVNRDGGVSGNKISLIKLDDQFKPEVFKQQFAAALEKKAVAMICAEHPIAMSALLKEKLLDTSDIVIVNSIPGTEILRNPGHPKLFHVRASDNEQFRRMLEHGRTVGTTSLQVIYQDAPAGRSGFSFISQTAPTLGYTKVGGIESNAAAASLETTTKAVITAEPQTVIVIGQPKFMADAIKTLRDKGYARSVLATSYLSAPLLIKTLGPDKARGVGVVQTFPNPSGATLPLHRDFQNTMAAFAPSVRNYSAFHLEGYLSARVLVDALKRAKGKTSPEALMAALRTGELNYGGFRVDFSKSNAGSTWTDMSVIDASGKLRY
jgi:branched-chain amino acid transport system substrate-binding protein